MAKKLTESQAWTAMATAFRGKAKRHDGFCVPVWKFGSSFIGGLCCATSVLLHDNLITINVYESMRLRINELPRPYAPFVWPTGDGKSRAAFCRKQAKLTAPKKRKAVKS